LTLLVISTKTFSFGFSANIILIVTANKNTRDDTAKIFVIFIFLMMLKAIDIKSGVNIKIYGNDSIMLFVIFVNCNVVDNENSIQHVENKSKNAHGYKLENNFFPFKDQNIIY
jgi:hypothetical protein